jgi:hypothetical protein
VTLISVPTLELAEKRAGQVKRLGCRLIANLSAIANKVKFKHLDVLTKARRNKNGSRRLAILRCWPSHTGA